MRRQGVQVDWLSVVKFDDNWKSVLHLIITTCMGDDGTCPRAIKGERQRAFRTGGRVITQGL